jgi:hypothetical protein
MFARFARVKKFATAFAVCLAVIFALNAATYFLRASSDGERTSLTVGLPLPYWREGHGFSRFRPAALCVDLAFVDGMRSSWPTASSSLGWLP